MLEIQLEGQAELAAQLDALPDALRGALAEKANAQAQALFEQVVGVNLSGGVLNVRSGALRDSIQMQPTQDGETFGAEVYSEGVAYAAIQEYGGKTAAHEILPDKARVLAFMMNGRKVFARRVEHPGSQIAAHAYLRSALDEQAGEIEDNLTATIAELAQGLDDSQ
jgi:phage gpG-like protein